jgi:hypothetical protein
MLDVYNIYLGVPSEVYKTMSLKKIEFEDESPLF